MRYQTLNTNRIKCFFVIAFVCVYAVSLNAQKRKISAYIFHPHWYLGANVGVNTYVAEGWGAYSALSSIGGSGSVTGGYSFMPALSLQATGTYAMHNWPDIRFSNLNYKFAAQNITADLVLNLSNLIQGYYLVRPLDISLYGGAGFSYRNKADFNSDLFTYISHGGLQADWHLTQFWDINIMAELNVTSDNYNEYAVGAPIEMYPALKLGFTYHFRDACSVCGK